MRRIRASVRCTVAGSSAGSPTGSEPSGSSRAARWPCMRCALTRLVAAWTACSSASSATGAAAGVAAAGTGSSAVTGVGPSAPVTTALEAERLEHAVVEAVLALEQLVHAAQEGARLGALDHAVVVGRGHRHDLLDAQLLERLGRDLGEAGRVADRAGGDDRALPGHQPRHARHGADPARVGEADVGAGVGVGRQRVVARARDQLVVAGDEVGEAQLAGVLRAPAPPASACRPCARRRRRGRG